MSNIMEFIKTKLKGSTSMPPGTGHAPHAHDHAHEGGCCGGSHEEGHDHGAKEKVEAAPVPDEDTTKPDGGGCCGGH